MSNVAPANQGGPSHAHGHVGQQPIINFQHEDGDEDGEDDDDDAPKSKAADKKSGRRKIKIEFINDKSRRHITFSKRKAGIMKKASPRSQTPRCHHPERCEYHLCQRTRCFYRRHSDFVSATARHASPHAPSRRPHLVNTSDPPIAGIRIIHLDGHPGAPSRRLRDRSRLHLYYRQAPASGDAARRKEPHPSLP
jgi:hypothetical protein